VRKYEVLNFAVSGYGAFQKLAMLEQRVFDFEPDAVLFVTYQGEVERTVEHLRKIMPLRSLIPEAYRDPVLTAFRNARVTPSMTATQVRLRLRLHPEGILNFIFRRAADQCREHGVPAAVVYRPDTPELRHLEHALYRSAGKQALLDRAREA